MSVTLSPMSSRRMSVGAADDPYKKYWWGILAGFIVTGAWLCIPIMETPVGSIRVDTRAKASGTDVSNADQSLDAVDNPGGAPGGALDLSMDGAKRKSKSGDAEDMTSMLYQAPSDPGAAAASGKPLGDATAASASTSLAQQLKDAGKKTDASGWNEKAQRGFSSPHLAGGSLPGFGSTSGGSSASAGGGGNGAFGSHNANVGFEATKGLRDDGGPEAGFQALKAAAGKSGPNLAGSAEALKTFGGQTFDGSRGKPAAPSAGTGAMQQANALYDAAPANLKANDPKIDQKKLPDPPAAQTAQSSQDNSKQMMESIALAVVGGMVGGTAGAMIAMVGSQMIQMQAQQQAAETAAKQQQTVAQRMGTSSSSGH